MRKYKVVYKPIPSEPYKSIEVRGMNIPHLIVRLGIDLQIDINTVTIIKQITV